MRAFAGRVPGVEPGRPRPVVYGRRAGRWLQYWMLFANNSQDRGLLRTGRHEGDPPFGAELPVCETGEFRIAFGWI